MVIVTKLYDKYALINDKEGNTVYSQGWFGKHTKSGYIKLNPYETVLLLERKKIDIPDKKETSLPLSEVVAHFSNNIPDFLVRFLLYKDLRNRGYVVKEHVENGNYFELYERGATPNQAKHLALVVTMAEGVLFDIDEIDLIVSQAKEISKQLIFAVIDSLGDVSYYSVSELEFTKLDING
ncbi:MAG: tRNA-splicing endonuclease [Candidatus Heimdallarchaeota archaeon AB_125]|nr:MAG: tRNA-splicing endonuclease [Candidatus Heimdallarchaeota archaeon AB_125]